MAYLMSSPYADLYEEFLEAMKSKLRAQTLDLIQRLTRKLLAWLEEEEILPEELSIAEALRYQVAVSETVSRKGKPLATGTMHNHLKAARSFFDYLVATERREANPFRELRLPRLPEHQSRNVLSEAQMGLLLRELAAFDVPPTRYARERRYRVHVIAELLYATGLRIREAAELLPGDLDLRSRLVRVREGKGGKPRTAFLTSYAAEVLERYLARGRDKLERSYVRDEANAGTLFCAAATRVGLVVNEELGELCPVLGLPRITSHAFRHSLGTHLLRSGCDMRHIQAILGHDSLGSTQVYTHVDKDDLRRSIDSFHPRRWHSVAAGVR